MIFRTAKKRRSTRETTIELELNLDPDGNTATVPLETGYPFLNHMLDALCRHGNLALSMQASGDREVDDHHTIEDIGIVI